MAVPRDNVRELRIGDATYQLEASLGSGIVYRNEFFGKLDEPYKGILADDLIEVFNRNQRVVERTVRVSKRGDVARDKKGMWIADPDGETREVENPDYRGVDVEALLRIAWAMARAAGSTDKAYQDFYEDVAHQPAGVFEEASLYQTVVFELGSGIIFRGPKGQAGAGEPDEAQEGQEG